MLIGGYFDQVGGGQANTNVCNTLDDEEFITPSFADPNLWVEPKTRDGVRNRSGFARLIGGATPGPGNIGLHHTSYSANKSQTSTAGQLGADERHPGAGDGQFFRAARTRPKRPGLHLQQRSAIVLGRRGIT